MKSKSTLLQWQPAAQTECITEVGNFAQNIIPVDLKDSLHLQLPQILGSTSMRSPYGKPSLTSTLTSTFSPWATPKRSTGSQGMQSGTKYTNPQITPVYQSYCLIQNPSHGGSPLGHQQGLLQGKWRFGSRDVWMEGAEHWSILESKVLTCKLCKLLVQAFIWGLQLLIRSGVLGVRWSMLHAQELAFKKSRRRHPQRLKKLLWKITNVLLWSGWMNTRHISTGSIQPWWWDTNPMNSVPCSWICFIMQDAKPGNVTEAISQARKANRQFHWYRNNIIPELGIPPLDGFAWGQVSHQPVPLSLSLPPSSLPVHLFPPPPLYISALRSLGAI